MTAEWRAIRVPQFCERVIGFSIPQDGEVLVISYEGMHLLALTDPIRVQTDDQFAEYDCYDPEEGVSEYQDRQWHILGLFGGNPLLNGLGGEKLSLDVEHSLISIRRDGVETLSCAFSNFSGDWAAATFSPDGRHIVLGCPYDFDFRVWRREVS